MYATTTPADPDPESVESRILAILSRLLDVPVTSLDADVAFEALGLDSADFIEIQLMLISEFDIGLADPEEAAERLTRIRDLVELVCERLAE